MEISKEFLDQMMALFGPVVKAELEKQYDLTPKKFTLKDFDLSKHNLIYRFKKDHLFRNVDGISKPVQLRKGDYIEVYKVFETFGQVVTFIARQVFPNKFWEAPRSGITECGWYKTSDISGQVDYNVELLEEIPYQDNPVTANITPALNGLE